MPIRTVLVCAVQVPLVHGGAEIQVQELVAQLRARGYRADLVNVPFKWHPKEEIFTHAAAWRLLDLRESNGERIDCVIATKFPSYFVRHPNKSVWLVHQHRAAYDLCGSSFANEFGWTETDVATRQRIVELDRRMLGEARRVYTTGRVPSGRLEKFNGIVAPPLHHPPRLAGRLHAGRYGDYVLSVGRLETLKRVDLLVRAMASVAPGVRLLVAGDGTQRQALERLVAELGVADRVDLLGVVSDEELIELYANALAVVYAPFDEDYGYVTLEAFLSRKPVVTSPDAGGVLEFVEDGVNGVVRPAEPAALADGINLLAADRRAAQRLGEAGAARAASVTWDAVIEKLVVE